MALHRFANSDGTIRQLDSTEDGSTPETSSVKCGEPVLGVRDAKTRQWLAQLLADRDG